MAGQTHAQHMKRMAEKRRRREKVDRYFGGMIVGERFYDYLVRHIDNIASSQLGGKVTPFAKCPKCGNEECQWLSTTNEWAYYCPRCDVRFNAKGEIRPPNTANTEWAP